MSPSPAPDWTAIDTVLLDMDGTLLDLEFDNRFWRRTIVARYAEANGLDRAGAVAVLKPKFAAVEHTLAWYCMDHWSRELGLDVVAMTRATRHETAWLPGARDFVAALRRLGKRVLLATNAHPDTLAIKDAQLGIGRLFDRLVSSHTVGAPKEERTFWEALQQREGFEPARTLFIDDSLPVLRSAEAYGIRWIRQVLRPDSTEPPRPASEFTGIDAVRDLLPGLEAALLPQPATSLPARVRD